MIEQGYVPPTCVLPDAYAGPLIYDEISAGRSPCWGCNGDRTICKGQPKQEHTMSRDTAIKLVKAAVDILKHNSMEHQDLLAFRIGVAKRELEEGC